MDELGLLVKEKRSTWVKSCRESSKRETKICALSEGMAEDAKLDGVRARIKKALKQLSQAREEERAAKELQEEMKENVERAQERVLESEENLCKELDEYMYSWEQEKGRPNNLSTKIWQMMQSDNTKSENLEKYFTEILQKTLLFSKRSEASR